MKKTFLTFVQRCKDSFGAITRDGASKQIRHLDIVSNAMEQAGLKGVKPKSYNIEVLADNTFGVSTVNPSVSKIVNPANLTLRPY